MKENNDIEYKNYRKLLGSFSTAFLSTINRNGEIHSRPMAIAHISEKDESLWFFTSDDSPKVEEISANAKSSIACMNNSVSLVISGLSNVSKDPEQIKSFWKEVFRVWFPDGVNSPHIALLRFDPSKAEYWDNSGLNGFKYFIESIKAVATGTTPEIDRGTQHGIVNL